MEAIEATGVGFNGIVEDGPVDGLLEVGESKASELELGKNICALSQAYDD